jgi:hypothetical protein
MNGPLSFGTLFRLVLDDTGLKASTVARELQRERSLMYKWLSGASRPPSTYVPLLVEVVMKHTSEPRQVILEQGLRSRLRSADLPEPLLRTLLAADALPKLLAQCLDLSLTPRVPTGAGAAAAGPAPAAAAPASAAAGPRGAPPEGWWAVALGALFAATAGGILWIVLNRLAGWSYYMGSADDSLRGARAFAWGLVTSAPVAAPLLVLCRRPDRARIVLPAALFTLTGAAAALLFYSSGVRGAVEGLGLGYVLQEALILAVWGLALSVPAVAAAFAALPRRPRPSWTAAGLLAPTGAALAAFGVTLLVDRPVAEVLQLRGFVVAFALRLALFGALYAAVAPAAARDAAAAIRRGSAEVS